MHFPTHACEILPQKGPWATEPDVVYHRLTHRKEYNRWLHVYG